MSFSRPRISVVVAVLLIAVLPATAQVTHLLQSPLAPVPAGSQVEIVMFIANSGAAPAEVEAPALVPMIASTPLGTRAVTLHRVEGEPATLTVAPGRILPGAI